MHTCRCTDNWLAFSNSFLWPPNPPNHGKKGQEGGKVQGGGGGGGKDGYWVTVSADSVMAGTPIIPAGCKKAHWCLARRMFFSLTPFLSVMSDSVTPRLLRHYPREGVCVCVCTPVSSSQGNSKQNNLAVNSNLWTHFRVHCSDLGFYFH